VKSFIQGTTRIQDSGLILKILFPNHPEEPEWCCNKFILILAEPLCILYIL